MALTDGTPSAFPAAYPGECSYCGGDFNEGDLIRADGSGEWEHAESDECDQGRPPGSSPTGPRGHRERRARGCAAELCPRWTGQGCACDVMGVDRFTGTSLGEMGY